MSSNELFAKHSVCMTSLAAVCALFVSLVIYWAPVVENSHMWVDLYYVILDPWSHTTQYIKISLVLSVYSEYA